MLTFGTYEATEIHFLDTLACLVLHPYGCAYYCAFTFAYP